MGCRRVIGCARERGGTDGGGLLDLALLQQLARLRQRTLQRRIDHCRSPRGFTPSMIFLITNMVKFANGPAPAASSLLEWREMTRCTTAGSIMLCPWRRRR